MKYPYGTVRYLTDNHYQIQLLADFATNDFKIIGSFVDVVNHAYSFSFNSDRLFEPNYFGKSDKPIRVRHVCLRFIHDHDLPSGYKSNSIVRVPILKKSFFKLIQKGDLGWYAGRAVKVIGKVEEKIFVTDNELLKGIDQ